MSREIFVNKNVKTLASAITSTTATSIVLSDVTGLPTYGNVRALIDSEILTVTLTGSTTVTVIRGVDSTTAATHLSGVNINFIITSSSFERYRAENHAYGTHASRPAAGFEGAIWRDSDSPTWSRDNGTSWDHFYDDRLVLPIDISGMTRYAYCNQALNNHSIEFKTYGQLGYLYANSANAGSQIAGFIGIPRNVSSSVDWTVILGMRPNGQRSSDIVCGIGMYDNSTGGLAIWGTTTPSGVETIQTYNTTNVTSATSSFNSSVFADSTLSLATTVRYWMVKYVHTSSTSTVFMYTSVDGFNWTFSNSQSYTTLNLTNLTDIGLGFRFFTDTVGGDGVGMIIHHWSYTEP